MNKKIPIKFRVMRPLKYAVNGGSLLIRVINNLWLLSYIDSADSSMHCISVQSGWYAKRARYKHPGVSFNGGVLDMKAIGIPGTLPSSPRHEFLLKLGKRGGVIQHDIYSSKTRLDIRLLGLGASRHGTILIPLTEVIERMTKNASVFLDPFAITKHPNPIIRPSEDTITIPWE